MKKVLVVLLLVGVLVGLVKLNIAMDEEAKANAIERCGGEQNIQERYTKDGDIYWVCK